MRRSCGTRASLMSCSSSSRLNTAPALLTVANAAELEMRQDARLVAAQSGDLRVAEECAQETFLTVRGASSFARTFAITSATCRGCTSSSRIDPIAG